MSQAGIIFDDTVKAKIIPVDLYSLVQQEKKKQFDYFGEIYRDDYKKRMAAFEKGLPQQMLEDERIAREITRAILSKSSDHYPHTHLEGEDSHVHECDAITFPDILQKDIDDKAYALYYAGLLDFAPGCCPVFSNDWCFETEIVYKELIGDVFKVEPKFNPELRKAITSMLKPFESEKALYVRKR